LRTLRWVTSHTTLRIEPERIVLGLQPLSSPTWHNLGHKRAWRPFSVSPKDHIDHGQGGRQYGPSQYIETFPKPRPKLCFDCPIWNSRRVPCFIHSGLPVRKNRTVTPSTNSLAGIAPDLVCALERIKDDGWPSCERQRGSGGYLMFTDDLQADFGPINLGTV